MHGLSGNDIYIVDGTDVVSETAGNGTADRVNATTSYTLGSAAEVETLATTNAALTGAINLTGNGFGQGIIGNAGANVLNGGGGNDTLAGWLGNDTLSGGLGNDSFLFNTGLNTATNLDRILDFNPVDDRMLLDDAAFSALGLGTLAAGAFRIGAFAQDADDRIVYNSATGALLHDSNGSASGGVTQFALIAAGLALTNFDFAVV